MSPLTYSHKITGEKIKYWKGMVPFDQYGRPVPYPSPNRDDLYVWKDNAPFLEAVTFVRFERGHSAAHALFKGTYEGDWECQMFLTDLTDLIHGEVRIGHFEGTCVYTKRGTNFGFKLLELAPPEYDR